MRTFIVSALFATTYLIFIPACTVQTSVPIASQAPDAKWALVWSDEFEGDSIDADRWNFQTDCWGGGNEERQCYTDRTQNARVENGSLEIIAKQENYTGHALPQRSRKTPDLAQKTATKPYTSARLTTSGKGDWRYGRIEVRAKLPGGQGIWPAIWMLPTDEIYGTWAASGEIDIMEAVNLGVACTECEGGYENHILGTLHYGDKHPDNTHTGQNTVLDNPLDDYHTYVLEWSAGEMKWLIDDVLYATQTHEAWHSTSTAAQGRPFAPFDQRFHLMLNVAVGGRLAEGRNAGGVNKEGFPKTMFVDWVRVYECASDTEQGLACQTGKADQIGQTDQASQTTQSGNTQ